MEATGMIPRYAALSDEEKYAVMAHFFRCNQPPTNDTFERAASFTGFELHLGSPVQQIAFEGNQIVLSTPNGDHRLDFLIMSTGLITDPALRPELRLIADDILRWKDRYQAPSHLANSIIDEHPYLDEAFGYLGRDEVSTSRLKGIFAFNYSAFINFGLSASALSGLKYAIPRLAKGIADQLFLDDRRTMLDSYHSYSEPEFVGTWPTRRVIEGTAE
jgi:FAD-dependent urate hydroxylase